MLEPVQSRNVMQAYLSYLQEMSRKISQRQGMENVLYRKTKKSPSFYRANKDVDQLYLRQVKEHLDKEGTRQLFFGNGLVLGTIQKNSARKAVAAPLISLLVDLEIDEYGRTLTWDVVRESVSLNYDLMTLILAQDNDEDGDSPEWTEGGIDILSLETFEDIEQEFETALKQPRSPELLQADTAERVFRKIQSSVNEFRQTLFSEQAYTPDLLEGSIRQSQQLVFYNHQFLFVSLMPNQLSTHTALRQLLLEVG
jgi:hypothetical protein